MAGIGFELKKIVDKDGYFSSARAYFMSLIITIGPMILSILIFLFMQNILKNFGESFKNIQLFNSIIIYSFLISFLSSSFFNMLMSRYVSDCIYIKAKGKIVESLIGVSVLYSIIVSIFISLLFINSNLNIYLKLLTLTISILLGIMWIEITYLSAVKNYLKIVGFFFIGILIIILSMNIGIRFLEINPFYSALISMILGYVFISISFLIILYKEFGVYDLRIRNCIGFIKSIDNYYELIFIGAFLAIGVYGHNIVIWFTNDATVIENTFRIASFYDVPSFYALLSIIPMAVMFMLKVETEIYPIYKEFYDFVGDSGSINEIKRAKKKLIDIVILNMKNMIEVQFIWSIGFLVLGFKLLPRMGFDNTSLQIFGILIIAVLSYISMTFLILLLLYFDRRKECLKITTIFLISSVGLSILSVLLGKDFYGYGFLVASLLSLVVAFREINIFFKNIEYKTFSSQPVFNTKRNVFGKIYDFFIEKE